MADSLYFKSFLLVLLAGFIWSFGAVVVRHMIDAQEYTFEYLFIRGLTTAIIVLAYQTLSEGINFFKNSIKINFIDLLGGIFLAIAFIGFIFSITNTTVAVTLFMLGTIPFIAAIVGFIVLGEILKFSTLISILISFIGILIMCINDFNVGNIQGVFFGLMAAMGFAFYAVSIRWSPRSPKFKVVIIAGLLCSFFSITMLELSFTSLQNMPEINFFLSMLHGLIISLGFILFSLGAKYLPSADLAFLTLLEVVGGILWAWLPFFGINEIPNLMILIGGSMITIGIIIYGINLRKETN